MSGRESFEKWEWLIEKVVWLFKIFPDPLLSAFWIWSDLLPGILGVGTRYVLARRLASSVGANVYFGRRVEIRNWKELNLGKNVSIHDGCYLDAIGGIQIGNDVSIAHSSSILSFEHTWEKPEIPIKYNPVYLDPVVVSDDVWIGCGCRLLAGVRIGERVVVAAGAVVTSNLSSGVVAGGIPARVIKKMAD